MKIFRYFSELVVVGIAFSVILFFAVTALVLYQTNLYFALLGYFVVMVYILYVTRTVLKVSREINELCAETRGVISKLKKR